MKRYEGKVCVITGGDGGIGLATAVRLAGEGATIVLVARNPEKLAAAEVKVKAAGATKVWASQCDIGQAEHVTQTMQGAIDRFGRVDLVVNNAGLMIFKTIEEHTQDDWMKVFSVDLFGTFYFMKEAFKRMQAGGAIVNVASVHAVETTPMVCSYAASKAAVLSLTRSGAIEGKPKGIRVNAVLPGAIDTPMLWENPNVKSGIEKIDKADVGQPEDVASLIAYLGSDEAKFVQGAGMRVDGGRLSHL